MVDLGISSIKSLKSTTRMLVGFGSSGSLKVGSLLTI
jgi:hypothetical protein